LRRAVAKLSEGESGGGAEYRMYEAGNRGRRPSLPGTPPQLEYEL